jgi:uncharacterized RDD family membrane protein YckC
VRDVVQDYFWGSGFFFAGWVHVLPPFRGRPAVAGSLVPDRFFMKAKFEPDIPAGVNQPYSKQDHLTQNYLTQDSSPILIDPEAYDASEQTFAASLEPSAANQRKKFVVGEAAHEAVADAPRENVLTGPEEAGPEETDVQEPALGTPPPADLEPPDPDSWRREVAARLSHYRARRRPREPRYPSLQLKFESEPVWNAAGAAEAPPAVPAEHEVMESVQPPSVPRIRLAEPPDYPRAVFAVSNEATAKVIEFASYSPAPRPLDELAEPVRDRPRIIEAPELVPPPPALGGILIESVEEPETERRPGFEIPLRAAPMSRRVAAAGIDAALVVSAIAAFAYIFFRITAVVPPPAKMAGIGVFLVGLAWSAYQYLLLVHTGDTPGLRLAKLELHRFDGSPVPRRIRRWRVLASMLSGVSLGLGYAWCLLDEDELCWHDRITRTYMAPRK